MKIGSKSIGAGKAPYILAELGSNHNGDMDLARRLIDAAARAGADGVKFQSWSKDTIFAREVYEQNRFLNDDYRTREDHTLESIVEAFSISETELAEMHSYCKKVGIEFSSTPFSEREVDFLADVLKVDYIKVASMDCNNYPFLDYIARKGKQVILSTGLSTLSEIDRAVQTMEEAGNFNIVLLHCVSVYPPDDDKVHLRNMKMLEDSYGYPTGFSDHSLGTDIPLAAIAMGACLIEKHFTLDKEMFGWDHKVSATEDEMAAIVRAANRIPQAIGSYRRVLSEADQAKKPAFRRSLVAARAMPAGHVIRPEDITAKRPGHGIEPGDVHLVVGRVTKKAIPEDKVLAHEDF